MQLSTIWEQEELQHQEQDPTPSASKSVYLLHFAFFKYPASKAAFSKTVSFPVDTSELYKWGLVII